MKQQGCNQSATSKNKNNLQLLYMCSDIPEEKWEAGADKQADKDPGIALTELLLVLPGGEAQGSAEPRIKTLFLKRKEVSGNFRRF